MNYSLEPTETLGCERWRTREGKTARSETLEQNSEISLTFQCETPYTHNLWAQTQSICHKGNDGTFALGVDFPLTHGPCFNFKRAVASWNKALWLGTKECIQPYQVDEIIYCKIQICVRIKLYGHTTCMNVYSSFFLSISIYLRASVIWDVGHTQD